MNSVGFGHHGHQWVTNAGTLFFQGFRGGSPGSPVSLKNQYERISNTYAVAIHDSLIKNLAKNGDHDDHDDPAFIFNGLRGHHVKNIGDHRRPTPLLLGDTQ
jgi:hypothetical protein